MKDWKISASAGCVVACGLWAMMGILLSLAWAQSSLVLAVAGLATSAAAATASIRQYHVVTNRMLKNAFDLGRTCRDSVHPLR